MLEVPSVSLCSSPETPGDDLVLEIVDASGDLKGGVTLPLASMDDTPVRNMIPVRTVSIKF